jgi:HSP20 family protein
MTLIKFKNDRLNNPSFNDIIDDFFNREVPTLFRPLTNQTLPAVNVAETKDGYRLEVALSWNQNDVNINLDGNLLSISGEHQTKQNEDGEQYTRREFSRSSFSRTFTLPETVDAERIAADFQNGLLVINVPKREEAKKKGPKTIQIGSNNNQSNGNEQK